MGDECVQRWMTARNVSDGYRLRSLRALERYCKYRGLSPSHLVDEAVKSAGNMDPKVRLRPRDMLNRWKKTCTDYAGPVLLKQVLPFFDENGVGQSMRVQSPKTPARENRLRASPELTRRILEICDEREFRWAIFCMAESGARPNSVVNLKWRHLTPLHGELEGLLQIQLPGKITKTGQPYVTFACEDALQELMTLSPKRLLSFSAQVLEHYVDRKTHALGINPATGLRPFTCTAFRAYVQNSLEGSGVPQNRVSLLMGARPQGRDAHYVNPPPEELAREYLKAKEKLRIYP